MYEKMAFNGPAKVLSELGYIPTYIDSYKVDWLAGDKHRRIIESYGFKRIFDRNSHDFDKATKNMTNAFEKGLYSETASFNTAKKSIIEAESAGRKAFVFNDTVLGHYNWKSREADNKLSNPNKIHKLLGVFDDLLGDFLVFLQERSLSDEVIIVVTGDHGRRYQREYISLNENVRDIKVSFNVPLMIYAPGLFERQVVLNHPTSHVDLAPTLLKLVGVPESKYLYHGENMLNPDLDNRVVFLMNQDLKPEHSFLWKGNFYTYNYINGRINIAYGNDSQQCFDKNSQPSFMTEAKLNSADIISKLDRASENFRDTAAFFAQKNSKKTVLTSTTH